MKSYYIVNSGNFTEDDKIIKTEQQAYKFLENSTNQVFVVDAKEFMKLYKIAKDAYLKNPVQWAFLDLTSSLN